MSEEEISNILDELNNVRPEVLNEESKRLFNAIIQIADERDKYINLYTNLKQIEQEHKKINGELREEIKQLKDEFYKEKCLNKLE